MGAAIIALGIAVFLANVWVSLRRREPAGDDPWLGHTLEWATTSPPPPLNFEAPLPPIRSYAPLLDLRQEVEDRSATRGGGAGMRGGAIPLLAWGALLVVLMAINWIWTGDAIQVGTFGFARGAWSGEAPLALTWPAAARRCGAGPPAPDASRRRSRAPASAPCWSAVAVARSCSGWPSAAS